MKLKIGFAGNGFIAGVHQANLRKDHRVEVASIFDTDPERGATQDFDEMLSLVDAVYITAPNTHHSRLAMAAVKAGKHVFCEKPFATAMEDAKALLDVATAGNKVFQVGHNRRFANVYKRVKALTAQAPAHTAQMKMNRGELLNPVWTGDDSVTGGFLFETPIHFFDMMRFQFGDIGSIDARLSGPNDFSMMVEFTSGMWATFVTSADCSWYFPYERMEVFGSYSTIETLEMESIRYCLGLGQVTQQEDFCRMEMHDKWGFREADRLFVDAVLGGGEPAVTAADGYKSVEIACAVYESAREKKRIHF